MAEGKAKVKASAGLNVRKGAGTNYAKIGGLTNGTIVTYYGENNGWLQIKYNGQTGWISKQYTSITQAATGGSSGNAGKSSSGSVQVTCDVLNVRKGNGTGYGIIGTLSRGQVVSYSEEKSGWLKISYKGKTGWISKQYTKASSSGGNSSSGKSSSSSYTLYVNTAVLNVRAAAGTGNAKIGTVSYGTKLTAVGDHKGWAKIKFGSGYGWVSKQYTSSKSPSSGGGGGGGSASSSMKAAGQKAANKAQSLYSQYVSAGWTYSQAKRSSSGHYDCSSFCHRCWQAGGVNFGWASSEGEALKCYKAGGTVSSVQKVIPGDLLFYHTNWNSGTRWKGINHVAIAVSGSQRIDAGGTPVKKCGLGSPVYIGRPGYLL